MILRSELKLQAFKRFAIELGELSCCSKKKVGCIIFPEDYSRILAIGYNGPPSGFPHDYCKGEDFCGCIHAEANALLKLDNLDIQAYLVCTLQPCIRCAGLIINSRRIKTVLYITSHTNEDGTNLLKKAGINVIKI